MKIWGPYLWGILHAFGEKTGKGLERCRIDEARELRWMIDNLETIVPCRICSRHIEEYRRIHHPPQIQEEYKRWFWSFHESVNKRLGKEEYPFESVKGDCNIREVWKEYKNTMRQYTILRRIDWKRIEDFNRHLNLWLGYLG